MPGARFDVALAPRDAGVEVPAGDARRAGPGGFDACELRLAANRGARLLPLRTVASGGELSRVMLALKSALGETRGTATMVFDEIDGGIGGLVAGRVGGMLAELAAGRQILCITHLPQIASRAAAHFRVRKEDLAGGASVSVERVEGESRVREIARMLGEDATEGAAADHARELLARDSA
jgi:DNA repair protein RecN (Recombination protein N)